MNMKQRLADDPLHYAKNDLVSIFKPEWHQFNQIMPQ